MTMRMRICKADTRAYYTVGTTGRVLFARHHCDRVRGQHQARARGRGCPGHNVGETPRVAAKWPSHEARCLLRIGRLRRGGRAFERCPWTDRQCLPNSGNTSSHPIRPKPPPGLLAENHPETIRRQIKTEIARPSPKIQIFKIEISLRLKLNIEIGRRSRMGDCHWHHLRRHVVRWVILLRGLLLLLPSKKG